MRGLHRFLLLGTTILALSTGAFAQQPPDDDDDKDIIDEGTITGKVNPPIANPPAESTGAVSPEDLAEYLARPFEPEAYLGAKYLSLDAEFIHNARQGLELIYGRDYKGAKKYFDDLSSRYQDQALGPVGQALIWQAMMIENFDLKYSKQYEVASGEAQRRLDIALKTPGSEAWEAFLLGGVKGIDAIHMMRQGSYLPALNRGIDAMHALEKCKEASPDFPDAKLGDGIYQYWRSVISMNYKMLPSYPDHRAEGIKLMQEAETNSVFVRAPASLSIAFAYIEERDFKKALSYTAKVHRKYPNNVIVSLLQARVLMYLHNYPGALQVLTNITQVAPENERVYYYLAVAYNRTKQPDLALEAIERYLTFDLLPEYKSAAYYRKGNLLYRQQRYEEAADAFREAIKADKNKSAKRRLDAMKKSGKI